MGHLINPVSFRVGVNKFWDNNLVSYKFNENKKLNLFKLNLDSFLERFFNFKIFLKNGFLYSHNTLLSKNNGLVLNIYVYKTIENSTFSAFDSLFLVKIFNSKVRSKFYIKMVSLLNYYFSEIFLKFSKNNNNLDIKKLTYVYILFQLKKFRFFSIEKFMQIGLTKNMRNEEYLNYFYERLFFMLIRQKFWNILGKFLKFYLKPYTLMPIQVNFYTTSNLSIAVIKKYITIRLQQRFKVSQIIVPIIKNLKDNKNILGFKFAFSGRFSRREMATYEWFSEGAVPLNTVSAKIDYIQFPVLVKDGICGIKVWINRKHEDNDIKNEYFKNSVKENLIYRI